MQTDFFLKITKGNHPKSREVPRNCEVNLNEPAASVLGFSISDPFYMTHAFD